jgi:hypothetical protein
MSNDTKEQSVDPELRQDRSPRTGVGGAFTIVLFAPISFFAAPPAAFIGVYAVVERRDPRKLRRGLILAAISAILTLAVGNMLAVSLA